MWLFQHVRLSTIYCYLQDLNLAMIQKKYFKIIITHNCLFFPDLYWSNNRSRNRKRHVHVVSWLIALFLARIEPLSTSFTREGTRKFDRLPHGVSGDGRSSCHFTSVIFKLICFIYVIYTYVISSIKYILSVFFHPHKKRNPQQLCYASSVAIFIQRKKTSTYFNYLLAAHLGCII